MKRRRETLQADLTPLIDVVFLLLIFFLVTSAFKKEELNLMLKLPVAEQGQGQTEQQENITIELTNEKIIVNGSDATFVDIPQMVEKYDSDTLVDIRADQDLKYKRLIKLLDLLQAAKLDNISLVTEKDNP